MYVFIKEPHKKKIHIKQHQTFLVSKTLPSYWFKNYPRSTGLWALGARELTKGWITNLKGGGDVVNTVASSICAHRGMPEAEAGCAALRIRWVQIKKSRLASERNEGSSISHCFHPESDTLRTTVGERWSYLSQLKPSTLSLQTHLPVSTLHSSVLPDGLQEHGLLGGNGTQQWKEEWGKGPTLGANGLHKGQSELLLLLYLVSEENTHRPWDLTLHSNLNH